MKKNKTDLNRKKELSKHEKYHHRKIFLRFVFGFLVIFGAIAMSPYYVGQGKVNVTKQTEANVVGNAEMQKIKSRYNPKTGLLVSEFFVGNPEDINDISSDRDLSNIKYENREMIQKGNQTVKSKFIKVNDHFFVIETKQVPKGFNMFKYMILPEIKDKSIDVDSFEKDNVLQFYVSESKVKQDSKLESKDKSEYGQNYLAMVVNAYQKKIDHAEKRIKIARATKQSDQEQISKLKAKKHLASNSQKEDFESQIDNLEQDIAQQEETVARNKATIKSNRANIKAAKRGALDF